MWTIRDGWTSRIQTFRDETGRHLALITVRSGDRGPGPINGAEMLRDDAWAQFFPDDQTPPILIINVLDPTFRFEDSPQIKTLDFDAEGIFEHAWGAAPGDVEVLNRLGAEWDEGTGFVPYTPPPPTHALVLLRINVRDLPPRNLFRDMTPYLTVDWGKAVAVALQSIEDDGDIPADVAPDVADAAQSLWLVPIELGRRDNKVWYVNGQHRTEAMLRQGVEETIVRETRPIDATPLPGEIRQVGTC